MTRFVDSKLTLREWLPLIGITVSAFIFNTSEFMPVGLLTGIGASFGTSEGVTGLIIGTRSMGNVIVTSDAVYTRESWDTSTPPGGPINKGTEAFLTNLQRLKDMQKQYNATMLFGHDSEQILEWSRKGTI